MRVRRVGLGALVLAMLVILIQGVSCGNAVAAAPGTVAHAGMASPGNPSPATPAIPEPGSFVPLAPIRILDTRTGIGTAKAPIAANGTIAVHVLNVAGVPATGVSTVVITLTANAPTSLGNLRAWADGQTRPGTSNLNFLAGQDVANLAFVPVGSNGNIRISNSSTGTVQVLGDISGYYRSDKPVRPGAFKAVGPTRVLDTRIGLGSPKAAIAPGHELTVKVNGIGGIPADGASAVVVNLTATQPAAIGNIRIWADGQTRPSTSNLNFDTGQTVANLVVAPVGTDGKIRLFNSSAGRVQLLLDVAGYFLPGQVSDIGVFVPTSPSRVLDTRIGLGAAKSPVQATKPVAVQTLARGGLPEEGVSAVLVNTTITTTNVDGNVRVWADGTPRPNTSNINFRAGQTVAGLAVVHIGTDGKLDFSTSGGSAEILADVLGYYLSAPLPSFTSFALSQNNRGISVGGRAASMDFSSPGVGLSDSSLAAIGWGFGANPIVDGVRFHISVPTALGDNTVAQGQTITLNEQQRALTSANWLDLLVLSTNGSTPAGPQYLFTVNYQPYLGQPGFHENPQAPSIPDWYHAPLTSPLTNSFQDYIVTNAITPPSPLYVNHGTTPDHTIHPMIYHLRVPLRERQTDPQSGRQVDSITLPYYGTTFSAGQNSLHVLSVAVSP